MNYYPNLITDYVGATGNHNITDYIDNKINSISSITYSSNIFLNGNPLSNFIIAKNDIVSGNNTINLILSNNFNFGEILFKAKYNNNGNSKIDYTGNFQIYHTYNILQPTFLSGWYDLEGELFQLKADGVSTDIQLTALEAGAVLLQSEIDSLIAGANTLEGELNSITQAAMFGQNYDGFKSLLNFNQLTQLQSQYGTTMTYLANNAANAYNNSLGLGTAIGVGLAIGGASIGTMVSYLNYEYASNSLFKNPNFTETQKRSLYEQYNSNNLSNISNYNASTCNLGIYNGFINSNILTTQYIPSLKSNDINYTGILYQNGNDIINSITYDIEQLNDNLGLTSNDLYKKSYDYTFNTSNNLATYVKDTKDSINNTNTEGVYTKRFVQSTTGKTYPYYTGSRFEVENAIYVRNDYYKDGYQGTMLELRGGSYDPFTPDALYNYITLNVDNSLSLHTCNQMRLTNFNTYVNSTANIEMNSINNYMSATNKLKINAPHIYQNNLPSTMILNFYLPYGNWSLYISGQYWYKYMNIENYVKAKTLPDGSKIRVFKIMSIYTANWDRHYGATYFGREIGLPDELTIYMSNKIEYEDGTSITNDNICNCRIYGRSKQTNYGYWLPFNTLNQEIVISNEPNFAFNHLYFATGFRNAMYVSITPLIFDYYNT